jgi:hypothetical protein
MNPTPTPSPAPAPTPRTDAVDHEKNTATGWDLGFEFEVDNLAMGRLHLATDRDLDATIVTFGGRTVSYRALAEEAAKRLGLSK